MNIAVIIISKNRDINPLLLKSLSFADEVLVVVDSEEKNSKSGSGKIKYIHHPLNSDFSMQRNFALQQTKADWILFVDDDEYVGTELQLEIREAISLDKYTGFLIKRIDVVYHQPLLHGETGNTRILRLARRTSGKFIRPVHEIWKINGRVGELQSPLYHIKNNMVSEFTGRMAKYGDIDSKILTKEGKPFSWLRLLFNPLAKFKLNYLFKAGILDGTAGLIQAYLMAVQSLTVRVFQWENRN